MSVAQLNTVLLLACWIKNTSDFWAHLEKKKSLGPFSFWLQNEILER